jgi:hypothetical protein
MLQRAGVSRAEPGNKTLPHGRQLYYWSSYTRRRAPALVYLVRAGCAVRRQPAAIHRRDDSGMQASKSYGRLARAGQPNGYRVRCTS